MSHPPLRSFKSAADQARQLADDVADGLKSAISLRGRARLVVSGGKSPLPFFHCLSDTVIDWSRVSITLADERWVPADAQDSNERLVRAHLLRGPAAAADFQGLNASAPSVLAAAPLAWDRVSSVALEADELVLGMGEDGHTASLFQGMPGLTGALDITAAPCAVAALAPSAPRERLSLNLSALTSARQIRLAMAGPVKGVLLDSILAAPDPLRWPVSCILTQDRAPVSVYRAP